MKKEKALELLVQNKALLREKYGVKEIALFGSTARDTLAYCFILKTSFNVLLT